MKSLRIPRATQSIVLIIQSILLIMWYSLLIALAALAYSGKAETVLDTFFSAVIEQPLNLSGQQHVEAWTFSPFTVLMYVYDEDQFGMSQDTFVDVLNSVMPRWAERDDSFIGLTSESPGQEKIKVLEPYLLLFSSISNYFEALASDPNSDPSKIVFDKSVIPKYFASKVEMEATALPLSAQRWIVERPLANEKIAARSHLVDTFLILVILGTFGSLIFLTKDLLTSKAPIPLLVFVFRPLFGMALSIGVFIVAILAHAVMTTAPLARIRSETMYLLGLGSGLLADTAYEYLKKRTRDSFAADNDNVAN